MITDVIPLFERDGFIITFEAKEEDVSARKHFLKQCGWTEAQYSRIRKFEWFTAVVSAWKGGKMLAQETLSCCSYRTAEEFYTKYAGKGDYFPQMVDEVIASAREKITQIKQISSPEETVNDCVRSEVKSTTTKGHFQ